jgi:L-iditol 2-dehydrogenase
VKALRKLTIESDSLALVDVPEPHAGDAQARIAVTGAGICGTDLHILHGDYSSRPPVTLGHEVAGRVDEVGAGVDSSWLGALVGTETAFSTCGLCRWCRTGRPMLCAQRLSVGSGVDGGFASHVVVPARLLHRLPQDLDDHAAALAEPLACACNALLDPDAVQPGDRVVVFGAGAVGLLAAQVAAATGGVVTVLGAPGDEERLAIAASLGFETGVSSDPALEEELDRRTRDRSVDVVIEAAGAGPAVHRGLRLVRSGGRYVQMGLLGGDVTVPFGEIVVREIAVRGSFGTSPGSWLRLELLLASGAMKLEPLITSVLPLSGADEAMARFRERQGIKTIFDPRLE